MTTPRRQDFHALVRDRRGVAFIEFAYTLPLLCAVTVAGLEMCNLALAHLKTQRLANMIADMVAQRSGSSGGLNELQLNDIFQSAERTANPFDFKKHGRVVITAAVGEDTDADGAADRNTIKWQRLKGEYVEAAIELGCWETATSASLPGGRQLTLNEPIYHAQVSYAYQPILGGSLFGMFGIPGDVTKVSMFRSRGYFFKPILTVIGQPVRRVCATAEGT